MVKIVLRGWTGHGQGVVHSWPYQGYQGQASWKAGSWTRAGSWRAGRELGASWKLRKLRRAAKYRQDANELWLR